MIVKNTSANAGDIRDSGLTCGPEEPLERAWQPSLVFLSRESHGQRSLAGYGHRVTKSQARLKRLSTKKKRTEIRTKFFLTSLSLGFHLGFLSLL